MPINDNLADSILLSKDLETVTGDNILASGETGEPSQNGDLESVWWTWIASEDGSITIDTNGSDFDTYLSVFTGNTVDSLTTIIQNDDSGNGFQSSVTLDVTAGTSYHIAVDGFGSDEGNIVLNYDFKNTPINDDFTDSILLSGTSGAVTGYNILASGEIGEPSQNGNLESVWWTWTAIEDGSIIIDTNGSDFDTYLSVFTGNTVDSLTTVAQNDDGENELQSLVDLNVTAGTTYHIAVDGFSSREGNIVLNYNLEALPVANDDLGTVNENTVLNVDAVSGVLANDTDIDSDIFVVSADSITANGARVTVNRDGSYSYDPTNSQAIQALDVGETLIDTFTYQIRDDENPVYAEDDWMVRYIQVENNQIDNTTEAETILANASGIGSLSIDTENYDVTEFIDMTSDVINFGNIDRYFDNNIAYPDSDGGDDFLISAEASLDLEAGTYTIAFGSDDGGLIRLSENVVFESTFNENGHNGVGVSEIRYENPRSAAATGGTFTLTEAQTVDVFGLMYERGFADSFEISIAEGSHDWFDAADFELIYAPQDTATVAVEVLGV